MKRILVHMCCGPCSIYPLKSALEGEAEVWGFFFNPNIQPRDEFNKRLAAVKKLSSLMDLKIIYKDIYRAEDFLKDREGRAIKTLPKSERCFHCYDIRLDATAETAAREGFDMFSSSLFYSRYQNHELMKEIAGGYAKKYNVGLFYRDFREGWQDGIKESKALGLYRQQYCGCIYSWMERYNKAPAKRGKAV
ncbi:MAG: epoxyqueuosine reductase QueH [Thermodesulfobacteriota bacterium]